MALRMLYKDPWCFTYLNGFFYYINGLSEVIRIRELHHLKLITYIKNSNDHLMQKNEFIERGGGIRNVVNLTNENNINTPLY